MNDIITSRDEIVDSLRSAGLRVATDQRDANPPCVLVTPNRLDLSLGGLYAAQFAVAFIAPDYGIDRAFTLLTTMIEQAADAVPLGQSIQADTVTLSGSPPLPAMVATLDV